MKKTLLVLLTLATYSFSIAQGLKVPSTSTTQNIKQEFGLGSIELSYSRPSIKGRSIFGDLVPYGAIWRTGANGATTLTFSEDVIIGGTKVAAGKYGLLTIPGGYEWTIIITKQLDVTSPAAYKQDMDVVRLTATANSLPFSIETFMISFDKVKNNSIEMMLIWDQTAVSFSIKQDVDTKIMGQIDNLMNADNRPYFNAAMYYMDNGKDLTKASLWFDKAIELTPNAFWMWHQKAKCLALQGKKADAKAAALKSIDLAKAAQNSDYVALNEKLIAGLK
jgi:hypothetical protein